MIFSLILIASMIIPRTIADEVKKSPIETKRDGHSANGLLEELRWELSAFLVNVAPDLVDKERSRIKKAKALDVMRQEIWQIIDKHAANLRPPEGVRKYISKDKDFVLVIAANADGINSAEPKPAEISDERARLVVAIGGDGCAGRFGTNGGMGGPGIAKAPKGVAVALGGRGGHAKFANQNGQGMAGGGGGGSLAEGGIGSIALGGLGGNGFQGPSGGGGGGGSGGGAGITHPESIRDAMEDKAALEEFRTQVIKHLANLPEDLKDGEVPDDLRINLSQLLEKYSLRLRPRYGVKKYVSKDKNFLLVIAANANGDSNTKPEPAEAIDEQARLVVAIGGDGSPGPVTGSGQSGGSAIAEADKGVALALGGRGGEPKFAGGGKAGGPGGPADAEGGVGSIELGGAGGKGLKVQPGLGASGPDGVTGAARGIMNCAAIREAMRKK
jgi:hypothetical protein